MEILGIGTDIVECLRIGRMIEQHGELFLNRVFTDQEIRYCQSRRHAMQHFSGRFAAKEAVLKSIGTGWRKGISWREIEIRNHPNGKPAVAVCGRVKEIMQKLQVADVLVSISHCRAYAAAYALALRRPHESAGEKQPEESSE